MAFHRPFDDIPLAVPGVVAEHRKAMERAEHERAAVRLRALEAQSSALNDPQVRITTWERLHALSLPRTPGHALVTVLATQTRLTIDQVHMEQQRRANLVPQ
ncbi:MAG: hypothetical protein EHM89_10660 [Acidobacteria bacterium]|nr:MAG: hypothetical protein EHM89_10660 [Acidobacteriota bacterium]